MNHDPGIAGNLIMIRVGVRDGVGVKVRVGVRVGVGVKVGVRVAVEVGVRVDHSSKLTPNPIKSIVIPYPCNS